MIKWLNWLSKWIVMTVLVSGLTVYITWTTVHLYVETLLGQLPFSVNMKKLHFSDLWDQMIDEWTGQSAVAGNTSGAGGGLGSGAVAQGTPPAGSGAGGGVEGKGAAADRGAAGSEAPVNGVPTAGADGGVTGHEGEQGGRGLDAGASGNGGTGNAGSTGSTTGSGLGTGSTGDGGGSDSFNGGRGEYVPDNALPVFGQSSSIDSDALDKKRLVMTAEQFNQKRELLSDTDKMRIFTLLLTRLPEEELQKFSRMVEDGISTDDLTAMDQAAQKYLKTEEYEELMGILQRF